MCLNFTAVSVCACALLCSHQSNAAADGILNNPLLLWLLKALPIYPVYGGSKENATERSSLLVPEIRLAPAHTDKDFLDNTFLKVTININPMQQHATHVL
jgi:hypothetical protein